MSLLYLLLAILGLGFLIFIHELGHYWMAKRVGMRVESFGIGFGRPIISFMRNGVKWNICWLPFGGYVKIAGMEKENGKEPEDIPDGFFGKSPWDRIKVAIMGPFANLAFAFLLFCVIWATGGREKSYSDVSNRIGWIDPRSELYKAGIRPGDIITHYDNELVKGAKDHFHAAMTAGSVLHVQGQHWDSEKKAYVPFSVDIRPYAHPQALEEGILTTGVLSPASFILFPATTHSAKNELPKGSPLIGSGIEHGDRIIWLNGESVYSLPQLSALLNDGKSLLTIRRNGKEFLRRVPRVQLEELKLSPLEKEELVDWQYAGGLKNAKFQKLSFIPYNIKADGTVENRYGFLDNDRGANVFDAIPYSSAEEPLQPGDVIVAIDGEPIASSVDLLLKLQQHKALVIVQKMPKARTAPVEPLFDGELHGNNLVDIVNSIGTDHLVTSKGNLRLLKPITPMTRSELFQSQNKEREYASELDEEKRHIQAIDDPEKRAQALKYLETHQKQFLLGLPGVEDYMITYNPNPFRMFNDVVDEVAHTLSALVGGYLKPKWISGPIGIVQVIHHQWMTGVKEALFWIAAISLNLGLLNLLPLPVLDGGYICLSLFELATGKRLKSKTIEKIVIPFAVLLISFLIFLTYHDLIRLLSNLLHW